jgi:hypothetical protein
LTKDLVPDQKTFYINLPCKYIKSYYPLGRTGNNKAADPRPKGLTASKDQALVI